LLSLTRPYFSHQNATPTINTLSLHDALPISPWDTRTSAPTRQNGNSTQRRQRVASTQKFPRFSVSRRAMPRMTTMASTMPTAARSEEHTSELQSHLNLVCRLLLEKKQNKTRP